MKFSEQMADRIREIKQLAEDLETNCHEFIAIIESLESDFYEMERQACEDRPQRTQTGDDGECITEGRKQ